jgi:hypothetical protein
MGLGDPVYCENAECTEYGLEKGNPSSYPLEGEDFICGECGRPVVDQEPPPLEPEGEGAA